MGGASGSAGQGGSGVNSPGRMSSLGMARLLSSKAWVRGRAKEVRLEFDEPINQHSKRKALRPVCYGPRLRFIDAAVGIRHGLQRRHLWSRVVPAYKLRVENRLAKAEGVIKHDVAVWEKEKKEREKTRTDLKSGKLTIKTQELSLISEERQALEAGRKQAIDQEREKDAREHFVKWERAAGRPPFSERYDTLTSDARLRLKHEGTQEAPQELKAGVGSLLARIPFSVWAFLYASFRRFTGLFLVVSIPVEIVFTWPAFEVVLETTPLLAQAAAIVFTLCMLGLGLGIGIFLSHALKHEIVPDPTKPSGLKVKGRWDAFQVGCACTFLLLGLIGAVVGAQLRSLIPEATHIRTEKIDIALAREKMDATQSENLLDVAAGQQAERAALETRSREVQKRHDNLLTADFRFLGTVDGRFALFIYLTILLSAVAKKRLERDPILEYEVAARHFAEQRLANAKEIAAIDNHLAVLKARHQTVQDEITKLTANEFSTFSDLHSLTNRIAKLDAAITRSGAFVAEIERQKDVFLKSRCETYLVYYRWAGNEDVRADQLGLEEPGQTEKSFHRPAGWKDTGFKHEASRNNGHATH